MGVLATDTIYGIVGRAHDRTAVERIYKLKGRSPDKPMIILIGSVEDLELFGVRADGVNLADHWPGPVSIILPCDRDDLEYLHRGTKTLAFRLPDKPALRDLLSKTGPLVAPSANPEGHPPARNVEEAKAYFGDQVSIYVGGEVTGSPSKLIKIDESGNVTVLRG